MARQVEIVTECKHGKTDPHSWEPSTTISDEGWCPGGSRRVLAPGEYVLLRIGTVIPPAQLPVWEKAHRLREAIYDSIERSGNLSKFITGELMDDGVVQSWVRVAEGEQ